jgi:hypothetical protein
MPAFFRPNGMRKNSNRPNGVMIAVLATSAGGHLEVAFLKV